MPSRPVVQSSSRLWAASLGHHLYETQLLGFARVSKKLKHVITQKLSS